MTFSSYFSPKKRSLNHPKIDKKTIKNRYQNRLWHKMPSKALLERSWAPLGRHLGALGLVLAPQGLPQGCPGRSKNRPKIILNRSWSASWPLLPTSLPPGASRDPFWSDFRHFWKWFLVFFVMIFLFFGPSRLTSGIDFLDFALLFLCSPVPFSCPFPPQPHPLLPHPQQQQQHWSIMYFIMPSSCIGWGVIYSIL